LRGGGSKKGGKSTRTVNTGQEYGYLTKKLTKTTKNLYEKQDSKTKLKKSIQPTKEQKSSPKIEPRKLYTSDKFAGLNKGKFNLKFNEYLSKNETNVSGAKLNFMKKDISSNS
jgi:hypothetical protein